MSEHPVIVDQLGYLPKLRDLTLDGDVRYEPYCLAGLPLKRLYLGDYGWVDADIAESFFKTLSTKLEQLHICWRSDEGTVSDNIAGLSGLKELTVDCMALTRFPHGVCRLPSLTKLTLRFGAPSIPASIGQLTNLLSLKFAVSCSNDFFVDTIPDELGMLTRLTELRLRDLNCMALPESFGRLTNLSKLEVSTFPQATLPVVAKMVNLRDLNLSTAPISSVATFITAITNLESLALSRLPEGFNGIAGLRGLTRLNLCNAGLGNLPRAVGSLTALRQLNLCGSYLETLPGEIVGALTALTELNVARNRLRDLPPEFFSLRRLRVVDLSSNQLEELSPMVAQLTALERLYMRENKLKCLPQEVHRLRSLKTLAVLGNPIDLLPLVQLHRRV